MRPPNRTYTEEFRSDALNLLRRGDRSVREVAAALGVSPWTLRDWYKKDEMARKAKNPPKTRPGPTPGESSDQRLARLEREDGATVSELAEPFAIKLPAVMKHLDVLAEAGLITRAKSGRTVTVKLRPRPMREAMEWLGRYERFWGGGLDRLAAYAERKEAEARGKDR